MFWKKRRSDCDEPYDRYVRLMLIRALEQGADKIVFGVPSDDLPRHPYRSESDEKSEELNRLLDLIDEGEGKVGTPARGVPMWFRTAGVWDECPGPPWWALHEVVRRAGDLIAAHQTVEQQSNCAEKMEGTVPLKLLGDRGIVKVSLTLTMEPNYCYSVALKKVD
ncbi:MAG TPA: hypothetical protein VMV72_01645 [Verrucomicrobiae bacterium]|nr:hypothetical protein [Verrucomicrobiae bacterium]